VIIILLFIRTLLLYRRHPGGPTIHQYGVLKSSVTGARVGLHPSKGGKRGWVFLLLLKEVVRKKVKEVHLP
jgi:hypothetical protein